MYIFLFLLNIMYLDFTTFSDNLLILRHLIISSSFINVSRFWSYMLSLNEISVLDRVVSSV